MEQEIQFSLDRGSAVPLHFQLNEQLRSRILSGTLPPNTTLPPVRKLAAKLSLNPNTIARVYRDLAADGLVRKRVGSGCFVNAVVDQKSTDEREREVRTRWDELVRLAGAWGVSRDRLQEWLNETGQPAETAGGDSIAAGSLHPNDESDFLD